MTGLSEVTILLAEDDAGHARLIERNLRRAGMNNSLVHVRDGQAAIDFALRNDELDRALVILLDLNMPGVNGYEVLGRLKGNPRTKRIPIIVLTTTDTSDDVDRCYDLGCNVFIAKPVEYDAFVEALRGVELLLSVMTVPQEQLPRTQ